MNTEKIAKLYSELQTQMVEELEAADGKGKFQRNSWQKEIGSGLTCVLQKGNIIEKAGLNFSHVRGDFTPNMKKLLGEDANLYSATGISSIIHPFNPHVPIIHMNVRYFALDNGTEWFGGGIDLTPHYVVTEDAVWFHQQLQEICDKYHPDFYSEYKKWADDYFFIPHRNETRGVGGIFFDRLKPTESIGLENLVGFTADLAKAYPRIYAEMMRRNADKTFSSAEKDWQKLRRGRYVEFNLVYDRGTKFGLESGGNTESILVSLPAEATWEYNYKPNEGSKEQETLDLLKKGIDWHNK